MMNIVSISFLAIFVYNSGRRNVNAQKPLEENARYFHRQHALDAINTEGKIYVMSQNYQSTFPTVCKSFQFTKKLNATAYEFTFAGFFEKNSTYNVKVRVVVKLLKTGKHQDYNALTYTYGTDDAPKFRKVMYISSGKKCMIFIQKRTPGQKPRCQLLVPAAKVPKGVPILCNLIYHIHCPGRKIKLYRSWCKNLTTVTIESLGVGESRRE